jgi:hypothetical protein
MCKQKLISNKFDLKQTIRVLHNGHPAQSQQLKTKKINLQNLWTKDHIHNTSFSSKLMNRPNKLVLHYTGLKRLSKWHALLVIWGIRKGTMKMKYCKYDTIAFWWFCVLVGLRRLTISPTILSNTSFAWPYHAFTLRGNLAKNTTPSPKLPLKHFQHSSCPHI